jgi:hypothetical protein
VISRLISERWRDDYGRLWLVVNLIHKAIIPKDFSALDAFRRSHHSSLFVVAHALNLLFAYLGLARASWLRILQIDGACLGKMRPNPPPCFSCFEGRNHGHVE